MVGPLVTGDQRFSDAAQSLADRSIETQTSVGQYSYGSLDIKPHQDWTDLEDVKGLVNPSVIGGQRRDTYRWDTAC